MFNLHTGRFARFLAALAILGLLFAGASTTVMAMSKVNAPQATLSQAEADMSGLDMAHHGKTCEQAAHADCDTGADGQHCNTGGDCCPHGATGVPPQLVAVPDMFPAVLAAAPQWRSTSVTPVTEIRPPISTL